MSHSLYSHLGFQEQVWWLSILWQDKWSLHTAVTPLLFMIVAMAFHLPQGLQVPSKPQNTKLCQRFYFPFFFFLIFAITLFVWFWRIDLICMDPPDWNLCLRTLLLEQEFLKALLTTDKTFHTVGIQVSVNEWMSGWMIIIFTGEVSNIINYSNWIPFSSW